MLHPLEGKMPNVSSKTKTIAFRLPNDVYNIVERRARKQKIKVSEYLKRHITYDATRRR